MDLAPPDSRVVIDGETFDLVCIPEAKTKMVQNAKLDLLGALDFQSLVGDLGKLGNFIRVAYKIMKLADKSAVTVHQFKGASQSVLQELKGTYQHLLDGEEEMALETLSLLTDVAAQMAKAADELHSDFEMATDDLIDAVNTQKAKDSQETEQEKYDKQAAFWNLMRIHCESLAKGDIQKSVETAMTKYTEEKRVKIWTSRMFKERAMRYYSKWVALDDVCGVYMLQIKETRTDLYKYLEENPTIEQAKKNVRQLAAAFADNLKQAQDKLAQENKKPLGEKKSLKEIVMASELPSLTGKVCIVTGASRGIGKGIALMLAKAGATVYITGRTLDTSEGKPGSLRQTAEEIGQEGTGRCIPIKCDHGNDDEVQQLFDKVSKEQNGRLDVLVNNAYKGVKAIFDNSGKPFYEQPVSVWDEINDVGLRSNYVAAWHAAKLMVPAKQGLIVNVSSMGGLRYLFNVAYGTGKAANDRMIADMAVELQKQNVACVSLWPGAVKTEIIRGYANNPDPQDEIARKVSSIFKDAEDPTFSGKAVAWLAADSDIMKKTGRILIVAEMAKEYGFKDVGGAQPMSFRQVKKLAQHKYPSIAWLIPEFVYVPCWLLAAGTHKF